MCCLKEISATYIIYMIVAYRLGAPHDGTIKEDDRAKCPAHGGYIMTGMLMLTENVFKWSSCSMEFFEDFFQ